MCAQNQKGKGKWPPKKTSLLLCLRQPRRLLTQVTAAINTETRRIMLLQQQWSHVPLPDHPHGNDDASSLAARSATGENRNATETCLVQIASRATSKTAAGMRRVRRRPKQPRSPAQCERMKKGVGTGGPRRLHPLRYLTVVGASKGVEGALAAAEAAILAEVWMAAPWTLGWRQPRR